MFDFDALDEADQQHQVDTLGENNQEPDGQRQDVHVDVLDEAKQLCLESHEEPRESQRKDSTLERLEDFLATALDPRSRSQDNGNVSESALDPPSQQSAGGIKGSIDQSDPITDAKFAMEADTHDSYAEFVTPLNSPRDGAGSSEHSPREGTGSSEQVLFRDARSRPGNPHQSPCKHLKPGWTPSGQDWKSPRKHGSKPSWTSRWQDWKNTRERNPLSSYGSPQVFHIEEEGDTCISSAVHLRIEPGELEETCEAEEPTPGTKVDASTLPPSPPNEEFVQHPQSDSIEDAFSNNFKYALAWDHSGLTPEAHSFFGHKHLDAVSLSDFDLVFVFPNPGHIHDFKRFLKASRGLLTAETLLKSLKQGIGRLSNAVTGKKQSDSLRQTAMQRSTSQRTLSAAAWESTLNLKKQKQAEQEQFFTKLIEKEERRRRSIHGILRCTECGKVADARTQSSTPQKAFSGRIWSRTPEKAQSCPFCSKQLEEVLKRCSNCGRKCAYEESTCLNCGSDHLHEQKIPLVRKLTELDLPSIERYVADLLQDFCVDPRQRERLDVSHDIDTLEDAQKAVIDMFLSFFRGQEEDDYYTYLFKSVDFSEIFLCVRMGENTLKRHAEARQYGVVLDREEIRRPLKDGGMHITYDDKHLKFDLGLRCLSLFCPNFHIPTNSAGRVEYKCNDHLERLLTRYADENDESENPKRECIFRKLDRIRLIYDEVTNVLRVQQMLQWNLLHAFYPLHTREALNKFKNKWARVGLAYKHSQPEDLVRHYFGTHLTLYFVFLEHILGYLLVLSIFAVVFTAIAVYIDASNGWRTSHGNWLRLLGNAGIPKLRIVWSLFVIVWCQVLHTRLKRKIVTRCNLWGADSNSQSDVAERNPHYAKHAIMTKSDLNQNELKVTVPWEQVMRGRRRSRIATSFFVCLTIFCSLGTLQIQSYLCSDAFAATFAEESWVQEYVSYVMSLVLSLEIKILNRVWNHLGQWLVEREHWRDRLDYDNAMAKKTFYIKSLTTFVSFFYIAFFMRLPVFRELLGDNMYKKYGQWTDPHSQKLHLANDPWQYLTYQMISTFLGFMIFSGYGLVSPLFEQRSSRRKARELLQKIRETDWRYSFIESQSKMSEYDGDLQNQEYIEILLPLGFVSFFGATMPVSAVICWIFSSLQLRLDAWKLCHTMRRPYPRPTKLGTWVWEEIIGVFVRISIITNIGLISFTMEPCESKHMSVKLAVFSSLSLIAILLNGALEELYPATSNCVQLSRRRHEHQRNLALSMFPQERFSNPKPDLKTLRAQKNISFGETVRRLHHCKYRPSYQDEVDKDDKKLMCKVFQEEITYEFW